MNRDRLTDRIWGATVLPVSDTTTTPGRREAKRTATRARLLAAARDLIAEGGFDAVTVADLTERADVGFGTFYGYFESKEAVLRAVVLDAIDRLAAVNDALTADLDDPAEVVAVAVRSTLGVVHDDPAFAGFLLRVAQSSDEDLWGALRRRMERDIARGVRAGRFTGARARVAGTMLGGAVLAALRAKLDGALPRAADADVAASALVLLGVPEAEATAIARRAGA
jgi:AcrR family transcriptional regulator